MKTVAILVPDKLLLYFNILKENGGLKESAALGFFCPHSADFAGTRARRARRKNHEDDAAAGSNFNDRPFMQ